MVSCQLRTLLGILVVATLGALPLSVSAEDEYFPELDVLELSLPELMNVHVTSVTKKKQELSHAPAAIFVLTGEDIRRSGVSSIPEALRMVPGISVAQMDNNTWKITSRGISGRQPFANKLLVLMDGRTLYTSLFSGVHWDSQDTALNDIDRIEVIRGPGASVWGANAVNGVINIITKSADETQGTHASVTTGTEDKALVSLRYGGKLGDETSYRVYGKYKNRDSSYVSSSQQGHDDYESGQMGFRIDANLDPSSLLTLQGDIYDSDVDRSINAFESMTATEPSTILETQDVSGGNLLARWSKETRDSGSFHLQAYYDHTRRKTATFGDERDTYDLEFQHSFQPCQGNEIIWGAGYRVVDTEITYDTFVNSFRKKHRTDDLANLFIQDQITLIPDELKLWMGVKVEHNDYSGWEVQPNIRSTWHPHEQHVFWSSISRAVRTPSQADEDLRINVAVIQTGAPFPPASTLLISNIPQQDLDSEVLYAFETGYRFQVLEVLSFDLALFYNDYDDLQSFDEPPPIPEAEPAPPHLLSALVMARKADGYTSGGEALVEWQVMPSWKLSSSYSYISTHISPKSSSTDTSDADRWRDVPKHQLRVGSTLNLPYRMEFDTQVYAMGNVADKVDNSVGSYTRVDLRLGWKPEALKGLDLSIGVKNLTDQHHVETVSTGFNTTEMERAYWLRATLDF